jgi:GAF domain-containing protein
MFSRDDVHFVQAVANVLAMAVERDRAERDRAGLLAAEQRARAEAERLAEVGRLITESLDLGEVAQRIADSVLELLGVDGATVLRLDAQSGDLRVLSVAGAGIPGKPGDLAFRRGTGLSGLAVELRQPVVSPDLLADTRFVYNPAMRDILGRSPIRSGLAVPLIAHGTVIGVLSLGGRAGGFDDEQVRLARAFGDKAALAIWNARLHAQLRSRLTQTETLLAVSEQVTAVVDLAETMRRVSRQTGLALGADMVGAFLADPDEGHLRPIAGWHVPRHLVLEFLTHAIPLKGHPILESAWQTHAPVWLKNVGADPRVHREAFERFPRSVFSHDRSGQAGRWAVRHLVGDGARIHDGSSSSSGHQPAPASPRERAPWNAAGAQAWLESLLEVAVGSPIQTPAALLSGIARACGELLGSDALLAFA